MVHRSGQNHLIWVVHFYTINDMLLIMDNIALIRTFAMVVEEGSFVAAANRLRITPQLVSKYVKALEDDLGVTLLNRTTRKISRTEAGHTFFLRCLQLVEDFDDMRAEVRQEHTEPRGHLRITVPVTFGQLYMVDAISAFAQVFPQVTIEMETTDRFVNLLEENIDVAVRIGDLPNSSLVARRMTSTDQVICASPAYLERAGVPARPEDLSDHVCVLDTNLPMAEKWILPGPDGLVTVDVSGSFTVNSASAAIGLGLRGTGIIYSPRLFVLKELLAGDLIEIFPEAKSQPKGVYALFHENRRPATKNRVFIDYITTRFRKQFGAVVSENTFKESVD